MPKLPQPKPEKVAKVLEKLDFRFLRQKGSHAIFVKGSLAVTVPMHRKELKKGTLANIIKQSGISAEEFISLL